MAGTYKDYIFGKMHVQPYDEDITYEKDLLEWVYIDLWRSSPVVLAGGLCYFMLIMDMILNMLKKFIVETKQLTRQRLMRVRAN